MSLDSKQNQMKFQNGMVKKIKETHQDKYLLPLD